jgi:hypothetical protein
MQEKFGKIAANMAQVSISSHEFRSHCTICRTESCSMPWVLGYQQNKLYDQRILELKASPYISTKYIYKYHTNSQ